MEKDAGYLLPCIDIEGAEIDDGVVDVFIANVKNAERFIIVFFVSKIPSSFMNVTFP